MIAAARRMTGACGLVARAILPGNLARRAGTPAGAWLWGVHKRRHDCRRGGQECPRHGLRLDPRECNPPYIGTKTALTLTCDSWRLRSSRVVFTPPARPMRMRLQSPQAFA